MDQRRVNTMKYDVSNGGPGRTGRKGNWSVYVCVYVCVYMCARVYVCTHCGSFPGLLSYAERLPVNHCHAWTQSDRERGREGERERHWVYQNQASRGQC